MKQKEVDKLVNEVVKPIAKARGWKFSRGFVFRHVNSLFFSLIIGGHAKTRNLHHMFFYKWYDFDDLFWKIVGLPENAQQPLSFRATGAWKAPMTDLESGGKVLPEMTKQEVSTRVSSIFEMYEPMVDRMGRDLVTLDDNLDFLRDEQRKHLEQFPGSVRDIHVQETITLILKGDRQQALRLIDERIAAGDWGGFGWPGHTFFTAAKDWVLSH